MTEKTRESGADDVRRPEAAGTTLYAKWRREALAMFAKRRREFERCIPHTTGHCRRSREVEVAALDAARDAYLAVYAEVEP